MTTIDEDRQLLRDFKRLRRRLRKGNKLTTFIRTRDWLYFNKDQKRIYFDIGNDLNCAQGQYTALLILKGQIKAMLGYSGSMPSEVPNQSEDAK